MHFNVAIIADIHFGAVKADQLYNELKKTFLNYIEKRYIDMVVIAGDFYNSITTLNSQSALKSFDFIRELVEICESTGIKYVRIIEGTLSHDNMQILNFSSFESNKNVDFRVVTSVTNEVLPEGIKILYLHEEYMENPIEYYRSYLNKPKKYYDFIFGHGMLKETAFVKDDGENGISRAPIWDSKYLVSICRGPIFFGHIHTPMVIRKHIHYVGSFSRWVYGQEEDKGFMVTVYDSESGYYINGFVINDLAKKYDTIKVFLDVFLESSLKIEDLIENCKKSKVDNLRLQVIIESNDRDFSYELGYLKVYFTGKTGFKLDIIDKREKLIREKTEEVVNKLMKEYDFLFKKDIPVETKIHKFIKRKYSKDVSEDKIKTILNLSTLNKD